MARSSPIQTSFLGGEWSKLAQGRSDLPAYHTALNNSTNSIPVEEGALTRRPGTQRLFPTHLRLPARLLDFEGSDECAFLLEVTTDASSGWTRFISGTLPVFTNDPRTIATATYDGTLLHLTLDTNSGWAANDDVMLNVDGIGVALESGCRGRVMRITAASTNSLTLADDQASALTIPALPTGGLVGATVLRIERVSTPWIASLDKLRLVQADDAGVSVGVVLSSLQPPQTVEVTEGTGSNDPTFTIAATAFVDGPYADPQPDTGTVTAYTGTIIFTPASSTFTAADVGRHIRMFSEPAAWASGTTYSNGALVTYAGAYWVATNAGAYASNNLGVIPGTNFLAASGASVALWAPAPTAAVWAWGKISAQAGSSCTVILETDLPSVNGATISIWQLGLYFSGQYPTCGVFHEGRLVLAGAVRNRFDASMSNDIFTFSPSDVNGVVNDNHAISYTLNAKKRQSVLWMIPDDRGIIVGTLGGEWLISATTANDILTPTSIQAHQVTDFKCYNAEPVRAGMAIVFIQRYGQRVYEYLADAFTNRFTGKHLNEFAKHLTEDGVAEIAYQEERAPIVWARTNANRLIGCTYRRTSRFVTENPVFNAWHPHTHGGLDRTVTSICAISSETLLDDRLFLVAAEDNTSAGKDYFVEMLRPLPLVDDGQLDAWYADSAPGNTIAGTLLKCGGRFPSYGVSAPGGLPDTSTPADLGDRAMVTPGTNPTLPPSGNNAALSSFLGFNELASPYFDGNTALAGFPILGSNSGSLSISVWMASDGPQGSLLRSSMYEQTGAQAYFSNFLLGPILGGGQQAFGKQNCSFFAPNMVASVSNVLTGERLDMLSETNFTPQTPSNIFHHLMISFNRVSGADPTVQIYLNDTMVLNGVVASNSHGSGNPSFAFPFAKMTDGFSLAAGEIPRESDNFWNVGGPFVGSIFSGYTGPTEFGPRSTARPAGDGMQCAMRELWISMGHAVDWSTSANRNKFHTLDNTLSHYIPVNLGATGDTLGFKPTVYCTGDRFNFVINRANGRVLRLIGGSGDSKFVKNYGTIRGLFSDDRVPGSD